jgi:FkbM family methyltransferase
MIPQLVPGTFAYKFRDTLKRFLTKPLLRFGLAAASADRFGIDPYNDMDHLAATWGYSLSTIFDVGANIGQTALNLVRRYPSARILSFEPHPTTCATLAESVARHSQIHITNAALGAVPGALPMTVYSLSVLNTLKPNFHTGRFEKASTITVPVTTLDAFCAEHHIETIDLLKIDTEGFDLMVLQGAAELLKRGAIHFIYLEINDLEIGPDEPGTALLSIYQYLRPFGFRFIGTYNDYYVTEPRLFQSSNALFALPPESR